MCVFSLMNFSSVEWLWPISCSWWPLSDGNFAQLCVCLWSFLVCVCVRVAAACLFVFCFNVQLSSQRKNATFLWVSNFMLYTHSYPFDKTLYKQKKTWHNMCFCSPHSPTPGIVEGLQLGLVWRGGYSMFFFFSRFGWWIPTSASDHRITMNRMFM